MPKLLSLEEKQIRQQAKLDKIDKYNERLQKRRSKELQKRLNEIIKTFIKWINTYNKTNNLISK